MNAVLGLNIIEVTPYISSSFTPPQYPHSHTFFELSFCVKGTSLNTINGTPVPFQNGTCVILRPGDTHSLTNYDPKIYEHIDLYCLPDVFKNLCDACQKDLYNTIMQYDRPIFFTFTNETFSFLFNQALLLKEMISNNNTFVETIHSSMILTILSQWIKTSIFQDQFIPHWLTELLPKLNNINFVQKNITQIAQATGFSLPYFSIQFKKYVGISAIKYLTKKRVYLAKDLLSKGPDLSILDISGMLGFENPSTFSKHFKQEFNLTPKEYRKNSRSNLY